MFNLRLITTFLLCLCCATSFAQQRKQVRIKKATDPIILDGLMTESTWQVADIAKDYQQNFPSDSISANALTEMRFTYDDKYIYIGAKMYNTGANDYVTPSLRRDFRGGGNDMFVVHFDTFDDKTNAFQFGINPFGVRREGLVSNGGGNRGDLSLDWENKWRGEATQHDGYWMVEMAIPFKSIRFKEGGSIWNINSYRIDSNTGERSTWNPIPRNFVLYSLAHTGQLIWDKPLKNPGANIAVIPYLSANMNANGGYTPTGETDVLPRSSDAAGDYGFDAKIGVGPALNLDLTVNPDFSQVEVDRQVTNLDRFEIFFPERRQFFLENADLFGQFGADGLRPFFSRRIGVSRDESTGTNIQNKINFGARLSGKLNNNWRIGVLNMQAAEESDINLPKLNYTVAALQRKVFSRSNIGLIFINKQDLNNENGSAFNQYNRVLGVDYNLASADNVWNGKIFYHQSFDKTDLDDAYATAASLSYSTIDWRIEALAQQVGNNYNPEVGFARRSGYNRGSLSITKNFYPEKGAFQQLNPFVSVDFFENDLNGTTDSEYRIGLRSQLQNTGRINASLVRNFIYLFSDFDPTREGNLELPEGNDYTFTNFEADYNSDTRKKLYYTIRTSYGEYFNGDRFSLGGALNYRFQPYGLISLNYNYNNIRLPEPYGDADIILFGPRFDITFSKSLFWTTFIQYNSQIDNLNINSRLQWRFKPVSDIFIAYTDNYFPNDFINKNRALVIKLTYWLNL
ncbi:hydrolase [Roseivirga misakiensis]|uniref:Hydrolase n=1 Tax=Roseivirga misakiensis TaxID=1563681 RepID=A0A1E5SKS2_9BACT|nr:hydrolase [Roseivirga misakiensis]